MEASFVERWYAESSVLDVYFVHALARFEVRPGDRVVFTSAQFASVLRWFMHDEVPEISLEESIEVSPWEPSED